MALNVGELFANLNLKTDNFDKNLSASMQQLVAGAARIKASLSSAGRSGGRMFSSGLAAGIASGRSAVVSAAARVAAAAVSAANARLKIASPSRVMEQSGAYFAEGFARGIASSARMAACAAAGMASGAVSSTKTDNSSSNFDYERLSGLLKPRDMALYMDGKRLAELSADHTGRAQSARQRRLALGYGMSRR